MLLIHKFSDLQYKRTNNTDNIQIENRYQLNISMNIIMIIVCYINVFNSYDMCNSYPQLDIKADKIST